MIIHDLRKTARFAVQIIESPKAYDWLQDLGKWDDAGRFLKCRVTGSHRTTARRLTRSLMGSASSRQPSKIELPWEGGDIVAGDSHYFVGTRARIPGSMKFALPILEVAKFDVHLDLNLAVIWDHRRKREVVLLSYPEKSSMNFNHRHRWYSATRDLLRKNGYWVRKFPMFEGKEGGDKTLYLYLNFLLSGRNAFLPKFGKPNLEKRAKAVLHSMGYRVHWVRCFGLRYYGGGLRCRAIVRR